MRGPSAPLYVVSKGRYQRDSALTIRALCRMRTPFYVVAEPSEMKDYRLLLDSYGLDGSYNVLQLDPAYKERYETCDDLGLTKGTGPGPARNFAWEHSISEGHDWHWVMDDNIGQWYRFNHNRLVRVVDGAIFAAMEDFVQRYDNVAMAGPNYYGFIVTKDKLPPFVPNRRIYSCNLIRNDVPLRWRGRYNEDTILSIDMLKAGWCTVQFNAFVQEKMPTQRFAGGNTAEFYAHEGTLPKSRMVEQVHPDVARVVWRFSRWHHHVDYSQWRRRPLHRVVDVPTDVDDYGMILEQRIGDRWVRIDNARDARPLDDVDDAWGDLDELLAVSQGETR